MKKLLIIQVAALSHTPHVEGLEFHSIPSVFPALTCTVQASFRTASPPANHGMIANGLFFRSLKRPSFWEQSAGLIEGERIWKKFRQRDKKVAMLFWQQSLGESVDILLSPAPVHKHHGGMIQDCYGVPSNLYLKLCRKIGRPFKLQQYWGPLASRKVGEWIVEATAIILEDSELAPDLCFLYLPTMDYDLQRHDPENSTAAEKAKTALNEQLYQLIKRAHDRGYGVLIYGDYKIAPVSEAVFPNLALYRAGLLKTRDIKNMLYPDFYQSQAFAVVDHEIAHVYVSDSEKIEAIKKTLEEVPGIADILDSGGKKDCLINHKNSGDLVIIAQSGKWMAYPWWTTKNEAPDYASHVDIHNKPGYDPCELFLGWPPMSVSQNTERINGSHGRIGTGREITYGTDLQLPNRPKDLLELAVMIRSWLEEE